MRMRVLIINSMFVNALYRRCADELGRLEDIELTVLTTDYWMMNGGVMPLDPVAPEAPYTFVTGSAGWRGKENRSFYTSGLIKALRTSRPDVIYLMEEPFSVFAFEVLTLRSLFYPNTPVVFFTWNNLSLDKYDYRPSFAYRTMAKLNLSRMQYALTANADGVQVLRDFGFHRPTEAIGYGVDTSHYATDRAERARELRDQWGVSADETLIGYVGRLLHMKGVDLLLDAVAQLRATGHRNLKVLLLGSGEAENNLRRQVIDLGLGDIVKFIGTVPHKHVPDHMHALDILVLPSRRVNMWAEQFGRVLVEAMAAGKIVIGSSSGAIPEVIGDAGFVFRENDVQDLANRLSAALTLDAQSDRDLRSRARARAAEQYNWRRFAERSRDAMRSVWKGATA